MNKDERAIAFFACPACAAPAGGRCRSQAETGTYRVWTARPHKPRVLLLHRAEQDTKSAPTSDRGGE